MSMYSFFSAPPSVSPFFESKFKSKPLYGDNRPVFVRACADVPDFLSAEWLESRRKRPLGPRLNFSAEEAVQYQLDALKFNDQPYQDHGIEVMYRFAGFDPFERSTYFGPFFDLGQFERFRRIFHHSTYRVLLGHKEKKMLSSLIVKENRYKQRVWVRGSRPEEEEIFQFTMVQVGKLRFSLKIAIDVSDNGGSLNLSLHLTKPLLNDHLSAFLTAVIVRFGYCQGSKNNMS